MPIWPFQRSARRVLRVDAAAPSTPVRKRAPRRPPTLEGEVVKYLRHLQKTDPARYSALMDQLAARQLGLAEAKKPDELSAFLKQIETLRKLERSLARGADDDPLREALADSVRQISPQLPLVVNGILSMARLGAPAGQPPAPSVGAGAVPSATLDGRELIELIDTRPAAEAAAAILEASQRAPGLAGLVSKIISLPTTPDALKAFAAEVARVAPEWKPLLDALTDVGRIEKTIAVIQALQQAMQARKSSF